MHLNHVSTEMRPKIAYTYPARRLRNRRSGVQWSGLRSRVPGYRIQTRYLYSRNMTKMIRIMHQPSNTLLAEGPIGWGITPFEGNYYISRKYLKTNLFKTNFIPGVCFYKFLYVWMDLVFEDYKVRNIAWMYWLPNPLFPFIAFRVAIPGHHPQVLIEEFEIAMAVEKKEK